MIAFYSKLFLHPGVQKVTCELFVVDRWGEPAMDAIILTPDGSKNNPNGFILPNLEIKGYEGSNTILP